MHGCPPSHNGKRWIRCGNCNGLPVERQWTNLLTILCESLCYIQNLDELGMLYMDVHVTSRVFFAPPGLWIFRAGPYRPSGRGGSVGLAWCVHVVTKWPEMIVCGFSRIYVATLWHDATSYFFEGLMRATLKIPTPKACDIYNPRRNSRIRTNWEKQWKTWFS